MDGYDTRIFTISSLPWCKSQWNQRRKNAAAVRCTSTCRSAVTIDFRSVRPTDWDKWVKVDRKRNVGRPAEGTHSSCCVARVNFVALCYVRKGSFTKLLYPKTHSHLHDYFTVEMCLHSSCLYWASMTINRLTPNDLYINRTTPLTSKRCILYTVFIQQM